MVKAGTILQNRYLIQKQIGAGGMGTVYVATDQRFGSPVAIKETLFDEDYLQHAFEREAQLLNSLRHPALPHVIDYFAENNRQYLVMEYFAGEDLSEILKQKREFSVAEVIGWADDLLDALEYLHSQKTPVVHRDIKPQNLKLTARGEIILLDFGLAKGKPGETSQEVSRANSIFGYSRSYAPLEQIQGTGTDMRSDIYSLGATIYHLLTGKPPVDAVTRATTFVNNQPDPLVPANVYNPKLSAAVAVLVEQALNLNPDLRPQTATEMRDLLQKAIVKVADSEDTKIPAANKRFVSPAGADEAFLANLGKVNDSSPGFEIPVLKGEKLSESSSFEQPFSAFAVNTAKNSVSFTWEKSLSITAAMLILGGGCFAAWYVTSQRTKGNPSAVNANSVAALSPPVKPAVANNSPKLEEKMAEKPEEKNFNVKVNTNVAAVKSTESSNKTAAPSKTTDGEQTHEERVPPPAPTAPVIVRSAPRAEDLKRSDDEESLDAPASHKKSSGKSEPDDSDDAIDVFRKQKKADNEPRQDRIERRERRVFPERRRRQKLPTLLGAPQ